MDVKSGLLWNSPSTAPWPPLVLVFPGYRLCNVCPVCGQVLGVGADGSPREAGCRRWCSGRGYMEKVAGQSDRCCALPKTTDLAALILSIRLSKDLDVGYMLTVMKKKPFFLHSENGIWIECDAHHYLPEERLLVKPDKFPNCERVIVCQYSSCSSFFVWRWAEVSLHRLLPAGVTTWLNDFWLREKLSPESQWKLTSMPALFFSSVL